MVPLTTNAPLRTRRRSGLSLVELRFFFGSLGFRSFADIGILSTQSGWLTVTASTL
jgi:hypothetical protein